MALSQIIKESIRKHIEAFIEMQFGHFRPIWIHHLDDILVAQCPVFRQCHIIKPAQHLEHLARKPFFRLDNHETGIQINPIRMNTPSRHNSRHMRPLEKLINIANHHHIGIKQNDLIPPSLRENLKL